MAKRIVAYIDSQNVIGVESIGIQGTAGPAGPAGIQGPIGTTGPAGPQGIQGIQGIQGPQGIQGIAGSSTGISSDVGNLAIAGTDGGVLLTATQVTPAVIGAQPTLVSGTSIKSIDGITLLGSGNIATVKAHSELTSLQGGTTGEYYHITAAQYAELQSFSSIISITKSLTLTSDWADTGIQHDNLPTGTYIIQLYANDEGSGGTNNNEYYSGTMSWYAGNTVSSVELPTDEITLHRAGNSGEGSLYLRTFRSDTLSSNKLKLQIYSNSTMPSASNYVFKFRRII